MRTAACWTLALLQAISITAAQAQVYRLHPVGPSEGLTNHFVHHMAQDEAGFLWIGTGEGAGRFDGRKVVMFSTKDGLAEDFVSAILPATDGNIWFGHNAGGISVLRHGHVRALPGDSSVSSTINAMAEDGQGGIWAAAQNEGIVHVDSTGVRRTVAAAHGVLWYSLLAVDGKFLLAGTDEGLRLYRTTPGGALSFIPEFGPLAHAPVRSLLHAKEIGLILAGTDGNGVLRFALGTQGRAIQPRTLGTRFGLGSLVVYDMALGDDGTLVIGTFGQGAFEVHPGPDGQITDLQHYHAGNGLGSDNISAVCTDNENGLWFARFGLGPARLLNRDLVYIQAAEGQVQDAQAVATRGNDVWIGGQAMVLHTRTNDLRVPDTLGTRQGLPDDAITALAAGPDSLLWAGSASNGLFRQVPGGTFRKVPLGSDLLSQQVHALWDQDGTMWAGTSNGVYVIGPGGLRHLTTENGLMHNRVNAIMGDRDGQVWMACNNGGVGVVRGDEIHSFPLAEGSNAFHVTGIAQDSTGRIWFSTYGNGIRYLEGDQVLGIDQAQGLRSDYCHSIALDGSNRIWASHRGGLTCIDAARRTVIQVYDKQFGIEPDRRINTLAVDANRNLWFGTDKGVLRFNAERHEPRPPAPQVHFTSVKVSGSDMDFGTPLVLGPGDHRLQFDFLGISLGTPDAVRYRYMLQGRDPEWIEGTQGSVQYMHLQDGRYVFRVQAAIGNGEFGPAETSIALLIKAPVWKRPWFIAASILSLLLATLGIIWLRERNQRRAKQLLQLQLERRTRELVLKNEEIALKNKDITDSINYAQRIQQAILPGEGTLTAHLPKAFILNRPRDIVSGDFHWSKRVDDKLTIVCADCTGHGVPGAFMSMIGSMLLREISAERRGHAPNALLGRLDGELRSVLHHQGNGQAGTDGMDISICEIDLGSGKLRSASAMHDVILVQDGRATRQRGDRRSIGGALALDGKNSLNLHEAMLHPGDRIYLFSDGVPDQFGGPQGKKLKVSGLMRWIEALQNVPMHEQATLLRHRIAEWMGVQEQVDDMLLIGIEL